jgi:hypothetical protein
VVQDPSDVTSKVGVAERNRRGKVQQAVTGLPEQVPKAVSDGGYQ